MDDGGYERPELWMSDGWATVKAQGWDAPLYWWHDGDGLDVVHPRRAAARSTATSPSCTSAGTRPTRSPAGPAPGCRPRPSGRWPRPRRSPPATGLDVEAAAPDARRLVRIGLAVDGQRRTRPIPVSRRQRAPSASTTASSWSTSRCCGAAAVPHRRATLAAPTATSSVRPAGGRSAASAWPATPSSTYQSTCSVACQ